MATSISDFLSSMAGGGARANRYEVIFTFPAVLGIPAAVGEQLTYLCKGAELPEATIGQATVGFKGRSLKLPGDINWPDWNTTIYLDNDFVGRDVFQKWQNLINGYRSNIASPGGQLPASFLGSAKVYTLDREDKVTTTTQINAIWPTVVGTIALDYTTNDAIAEQPVTFAVNEVIALGAGRVGTVTSVTPVARAARG